MRILAFIHSFEPAGGERVALRLIRQWRAHGVDALLFSGRSDGAMRDDVGRNLDFLSPPIRPWLVTYWETLWMIATLPRVIREHRPDVLFCPGNTYVIVAVALKLLLGTACPPIVAKISNDLDRQDHRPLARRCYRWWLRLSGRFLDHVIATELPMAAEVHERLGITARETTLIRNPVLSLAEIARLRGVPRSQRSEKSGRRFVAIGRLAAQKNLPMMLDAFARGAEPRDTLTIVGVGPEQRRLVQQVRSLHLEMRVRFAGYRCDTDVILADADVLLLSSDYEGVPAVVIEALAANVAVIATECSRSIRAILDDGRFGALVPVGDVAVFAAAIAQATPQMQDATATLAHCQRFAIESAAPRFLAVMRPLARDFAAARSAIELHFPIGDSFA